MQNYESNEAENFPQSPVKKDILSTENLPVSPNNPPWGSLMAFGVWLLSVALILFLPLIFVLPYILANRSQLETGSLLTDSTAIILNVLAVIPAHALTLIFAWLIATQNKKYSFKEVFGWKSGGFAWWHYLIIIGGFFILAALVNLVLPAQENEMTKILASSRTTVYLVAFMATFTAPIVEEVVYRGFLYSAFQRTFGVGRAVAIVTFLFAGVHFVQYWGSPGTILVICLLSLILTLVRVRSNNLLPCVILHTIFNGVQAIGLILIEDLAKPKPTVEGFFHLLNVSSG